MFRQIALPSLAIVLASCFLSNSLALAKQAPSGWVEDDEQPPGMSSRGGQGPAVDAGMGTGSAGAGMSAGAQARMSAGTPAGIAPGGLDGGMAPPSSGVSVSPDGRHMLQAGIQHSVELRPVPSNLAVGAHFDEGLMHPSPSVDEWYWIPSWLAGEWRRDSEIVISTYDYISHQRNDQPQTINETQVAAFGMQRDRNGGIWHCRLANTGMADFGSSYSVALIQKEEPVLVTPTQVVVRDRFIDLQVNKETDTIMNSNQAEAITSYRPNPDGTLATSASVKFFDADGSAQKSQQNRSIEHRTQPFELLNMYKGVNINVAFKKFLLTHGKSELMPP